MTALIFPRLQHQQQSLQSSSVQCLKTSDSLFTSITKQWREDQNPGNPFLKYWLVSLPDPYTNRSFLDTYISLLVIACDKIPPIKPGGASLAIAAIGSPGRQSGLSVPSSCAGWDTAQVHMLQMPKDGLVQWCICEGCLTLIFIFLKWGRPVL